MQILGSTATLVVGMRVLASWGILGGKGTLLTVDRIKPGFKFVQDENLE